jgi:hypothetical protein
MINQPSQADFYGGQASHSADRSSGSSDDRLGLIQGTGNKPQQGQGQEKAGKTDSSQLKRKAFRSQPDYR